MTHDQSNLDELFHHARDFGSPDAQAIVRAWDAETQFRPLEIIEMANAEDLRDELKQAEDINDKLEERIAKLENALSELRWKAYDGARRLSCEFDDSYDFYQDAAAQEAAGEYAPDLSIRCAYVKIDNGDLEEIWVSSSYSAKEAFDRVY
jgi:predicted nuclease with TOPRIM domain